MAQSKMLFKLDDEQARAVERFRDFHLSSRNRVDEDQEHEHRLEWHLDDNSGEVAFVCSCGATLHVTKPIYVTVEAQSFKWDDDALAKRIADEMTDAAMYPREHMLDATPAGFFTYLYGIGATYELANRDAFPSEFPRAVLRRFIETACGPNQSGKGFDDAIDACGSDSRAFEIIEEIVPQMIEEHAPEIAHLDLGAEKDECTMWLRERKRERDVASESLFQSALVTLPDETLEQIRLRPSTSDMHFGLGLYLRNRFVHSGLLYSGIDPDDQSHGALDKLIRHCLPEFEDHSLIYDRISSELLYDAYRYCMEIRGSLPEAELKKHYDILLEAQSIDDSNPYSIIDDEHRDEWRAWNKRACEKRCEYDLATLREIWDFEAIRNDLGQDIASRCEGICLAAKDAKRAGFMPSEIAYVLAGNTDEKALKAFDWAVKDYKVAGFLPDELFERRDLALDAVSSGGRQLERAKAFQDDDEIVLVAVKNDPRSIEFASARLQEDRRVLVAAAANAEDELVFFESPMVAHNDDDELVELALRANGMNIAFASERVRSSLKYAKLAWENVRNPTHFGMYDYLSDELKENLELALIIARNCDMMPSHFPPKALADNDELGRVLSERDSAYYLENMSRRIKEAYMTEEDLKRRGGDPRWWNDEEKDNESM